METVIISMDVYIDMLEDRFRNAPWAPTEAEESLWSLFLNLIREVGVNPDKSDPKYIVDNYLVNSEIVERSEFTPDGDYSWYYNKYQGDWESLCEDCLISNDLYALVQF